MLNDKSIHVYIYFWDFFYILLMKGFFNDNSRYQPLNTLGDGFNSLTVTVFILFCFDIFNNYLKSHTINNFLLVKDLIFFTLHRN